MGYPMARQLLQAGHEVALWTHAAPKARELAKEGKGTACATPKEVAQRADYIFYCVGDSAMDKSVAMGADGLLAEDGLHRIAITPATSETGTQAPAFRPAESAAEAAERARAAEEEADRDLAIGEPVLTADELRALLQEQPSLPPSGGE